MFPTPWTKSGVIKIVNEARRFYFRCEILIYSFILYKEVLKMQRRARIKAVANLSASRRTGNKSSSEISKKTEVENDEVEKKEIKEQKKLADSSLPGSSSPRKSSPSDHLQNNCTNSKSNEEKIPETISAQANSDKDQKYPKHEQLTVVQSDTATFKAPLQLPRNESDAPGSSQPVVNKRRFKIAPCLNASRNVHKIQVKLLFTLCLI